MAQRSISQFLDVEPGADLLSMACSPVVVVVVASVVAGAQCCTGTLSRQVLGYIVRLYVWPDQSHCSTESHKNLWTSLMTKGIAADRFGENSQQTLRPPKDKERRASETRTAEDKKPTTTGGATYFKRAMTALLTLPEQLQIHRPILVRSVCTGRPAFCHHLPPTFWAELHSLMPNMALSQQRKGEREWTRLCETFTRHWHESQMVQLLLQPSLPLLPWSSDPLLPL